MRHKLLFALLAIVFVAASCSKSGKTDLLVPKDAGYVVYFNTPSISSKLSWEEIKKSAVFERMTSQTSDSLGKRLLNDPSSSGVDTKSPFVMFAKKQGQGGYIVIQGKLADTKALEKTLGEVKEKKLTIAKGDGFSYTILEDDAILSWTDKRFVLLGNAPAGTFSGSGYSRSESFGSDSLLLFIKNTYNLSGSKLLDSDSRFTKLIKSEGDIHFWIASEYTNSYSDDAMMSSLKLDRLMKDNVTTGTVKFENGKITAHMDQYNSKELQNILKKYEKGAINASLTNRLPANAPVVAAMVAPLPAINDIFKLLGLDGTANLFLTQYGLNVETITKAFKGEMVFALSGFESKKDTLRFGPGTGSNDMYVYEKNDPSYLFGVAIGDQKAYTQVYTTLEDKFLKDVPPSIKVINDKDWLLISNSDADVATFRGSSSKPAYADRFNGHQFALYTDIRQMMTFVLKPDIKDNPERQKIYDLSMNTWENLWIFSDLKDGRYSTDFEVNLVNKQVNSLKQLHDYAVQMVPEKAVVDEDIQYDGLDTVAPPPPPAPMKPLTEEPVKKK
ncbi:MAG: hypothetical protein ABS85_02470 [Sphingobacteriales bacterium SCN 48-20]|uniref:DUF4836 family protein n=1 Tax=Terrimonas ferruginea TaxID=249 RepID=UPI00086B45F5|nr:DUF4836 family protein [Terrimonas ferruginea]MBN8781517.1 DUF4836 family protein [Terrimonas ferruginea]ODT94837.1 MAG: hypothetical protein ABS85_02470 [Sphingobacteriales bacterium SCN 48-20]OJW44681.1 MAG: hypothetical protein BGO56_14555 [Sphingobacteriales bacterium 48-107]